MKGTAHSKLSSGREYSKSTTMAGMDDIKERCKIKLGEKRGVHNVPGYLATLSVYSLNKMESY